MNSRDLKGQKLEEKLLNYLHRQNEDKILYINVESVPAVENLDELLSFAELDGILRYGPGYPAFETEHGQ